jgi:hypothetical protein
MPLTALNGPVRSSECLIQVKRERIMPEKLIRVVFVVIAILPSTQLLSQMNQQAPSSQAPAKIELSPLRMENRLGENVPLQVTLLDRYGRPATAPQSIAADVKVQQPSGQITTYSVNFAPGESTKQLPVSIPETGVAKVTVEQHERQLIGGSNFVLVRPDGAKPQGKPPKSAKAPKATQAKGPSARWRDIRGFGMHAHLIEAAFQFPGQPAPVPGPSSSSPQLQMVISGENANGGTRADGHTCAQVQVFYLGETDLQHDVQVWLSPSNGSLDQNPIVIHKGSASGSACWTSLYPLSAATITVAATNPPNFTFVSLGNGSDPRKTTHKFTDNISGIDFVNAPESITIVDSFYLTARFKDANDQTVRLTDPRDVHFSSTSSALGINPKQTTVVAGGFDSSTVLIPTFFGKSTVQVFTPDYPTVTHSITITWIGVLFASLLGGFLGGLLAWINSDGKLFVRILTGLIVGLVASWAYVIVGLPKVDLPFLHNQLSVFFVALLVGLSGVKGATFISSKFGLPSF